MKRLLIVFLLLGAGCSSASADRSTTPPPVSRPSTSIDSEAPEAAPPPASFTPAAPTTTIAPPPPPPTATLDVHSIWAFPGPHQYEGDVVTLQLPLGGFDEHELGDARVTIDGEVFESRAILSGDPLVGRYVIFPDVFDTGDRAGTHRVEVEVEIDGIKVAAEGLLSVAPASERPEQETHAEWETQSTECCDVHYLTNSAAARDAGDLVDLIDASAALVAEEFGRALPRVDVVLIDVLWGNGGYAGGELVISYLDRDFGPRSNDTLGMTFTHEFTHAMTNQIGRSVPWPLEEAIAVYTAGGHFKPESLASRAKALRELGRLLPLGEFLEAFPTLQHESRYVQAGAMATYLVDTYGWEAFLDLNGSGVRARTDSEWFDRAATRAFGASLEEIDRGFAAWVDAHESGDERADLELTIALQEARRTYQTNHAPYQNFFVYPSVLEVAQPVTAMRESDDLANIAVEALIGWGQQLIIEGRYDEAQGVVAEVERVTERGRISGGLAAEFLDVAQRLANRGLELLDLDLTTAGAAAVATPEPPVVVDLRIDRFGAITAVVTGAASGHPLVS